MTSDSRSVLTTIGFVTKGSVSCEEFTVATVFLRGSFCLGLGLGVGLLKIGNPYGGILIIIVRIFLILILFWPLQIGRSGLRR